MRKKWIYVVVVTVALFGVLFLRPKKEEANKLTNLKLDDVREVVSGTGTLGAGGVTAIYSPSAGVIKSIYVKNGQSIKTGDKLFEVTSSATDLEKAAALADLLAARSALKTAENAKNTLQSSLETARKTIFETANTRKVFDENVLAQKPNPSTGRAYTEEEKMVMISSVDVANKGFKNTEKQYLDADEAIRSARAVLSEASIAYEATRDSTTKSPITGKIYNLKKIVGDSVPEVTAKEAVLVIANLETLTIDFQVSEYSVNKLSIGQGVEITFDALYGDVLKGEVVGVDTIGSESLGTVSYGVSIRVLPNEEQLAKIRPAMTANITIVTNQKNNVPTIFRSAVRLKEGKYFAIVVKNGKREIREIKPGLIGTDKVEILEGINDSDKVLRVYEE